MRRLGTLAAALVLAACTPGPAAGPTPSPAEGSPGASAVSGFPIDVATSRYGAFEIKTRPRGTCDLSIRVNAGVFGDGPPETLSAVADIAGLVSWTYPAPLVPAGRGTHVVSCHDDREVAEARSPFDITLKSLDAKAFTVRVHAVDPIAGLTGLTVPLEPSLVPARDAAMTRLTKTLAMEWATATRGLGALTVVPSNADIVVYVVPARGTSVHATSRDGTQRVLIYVVDELGAVTPENTVATALHELGHIWCCRGTEAGPDGHWVEKVPDPLLQGLDKFGLMTHPVTCLVRPGLQSCPNRFSERELRAMGFTEIPAPPPDPCVTQATALRSELSSLDAALADERVRIQNLRNDITVLAEQIAVIERQYPDRRLPPDVQARYVRLVDEHNTKLADYQARVASYNERIDTRNKLAQRLNALPC